MKQFVLCTLCVLTASTLLADGDRTQRITFKHREANGIGYPTGYTSAEGFFSTSKTPNLLAFTDVRAHVFNDSKKAYNLGVGVRGLSEPLRAVLGANVFYDYRDGLHRAFNQVGVGLEVLGTKWDVRANGYIPVHNIKKKYRDGFLKFKGSSAVFQKRYEFAFVGCELAFTRELIKRKNWDVRTKLAGYWFNGEYGKNAGGGLFELSTNITRYLTLKGQASYDTLFRGVFQGEAAVNFPFGWRLEERDSSLPPRVIQSLEDRLIETVDRFEMIVTSTKRKKAVALDPLTGEPLTFVFVDNTSHSLGTFESPFPTLVQAQNAAAPGDVIYIFPGDGTTTGMDQGITLQDNQTLAGSAAPLTVTTGFGLRTVPAQTSALPSITNTGGGFCIIVGNNNTISGLDINCPLNSPIDSNGATIFGINVTHNRITTANNNNAVNLNDFFGTGVFSDNILQTDSGGIALNIENQQDTCTFVATNNFFNTAGAFGIAFASQFSTVEMVMINSNAFVSGTNSAIQVGITGQSDVVSATIANNIIGSVTSDAILVQTAGSAAIANMTISKNQIAQAGNFGITILCNNNATPITPSFINLVDNIVLNANENDAGKAGISIRSQNQSNLQVRLSGNASSALNGGFGYLLFNANAPTSVLSVQTPDLANPQAGLQAINIGSFDPASFTDGVTFIPFVP